MFFMIFGTSAHTLVLISICSCHIPGILQLGRNSWLLNLFSSTTVLAVPQDLYIKTPIISFIIYIPFILSLH